MVIKREKTDPVVYSIRITLNPLLRIQSTLSLVISYTSCHQIFFELIIHRWAILHFRLLYHRLVHYICMFNILVHVTFFSYEMFTNIFI